VKCGDEHYAVNCTNKLEEPAKCANCSENHTADYKRCQIFKKILTFISNLKPKQPKEKIDTFKQILYHLHLSKRSPQTQNENLRMPKLQRTHHLRSNPLQIVTNFLNGLKIILTPLYSNISNKQNPTPHHLHSLINLHTHRNILCTSMPH